MEIILYFLVLALWAFLSQGLISRVPPFQKIANLSAPASFLPTLEGLRGIAAVSVFIHHSAMCFNYVKNGVWRTESKFINFLGSSSVALFFFITGFLFWSKLREREIKICPYFVSRIKRLTPAYLGSLALLILVVVAFGGFRLKEPSVQIAKALSTWLTFSVFNQFRPPVNAFPDSNLVNAGILWTLRLEWYFYFLLPTLAWFSKRHRVWLIFLFVAYAPEMLATFGFSHWAFSELCLYFRQGFIWGMLVSYILGKGTFSWARGSLAALVGISALALAAAYSGFVNEYAICALEALFFYFIASGNSIFGVLKARPILFLGRISYSIYLLHGIVLYSVYRLLKVHGYLSFGVFSGKFWGLVTVNSVLLLGLSLISYWLLEFPFQKNPSKSPEKTDSLGKAA